jgi:hypothetical protein
MKLNKLTEKALSQLDNLGFALGEMGITDQVNRHTCIAFVLNEQTKLKGELDSIQARVGSRKVQVTRLANKIEKTLLDTVNLALSPAKAALNTFKGVLGQ